MGTFHYGEGRGRGRGRGWGNWKAGFSCESRVCRVKVGMIWILGFDLDL